MRVIIAGSGEIAYQFAGEMVGRRDTVVIAENPDEVGRFDKLDVQLIVGSPADSEVLRALDICDDDDFIACSESDERNIIACLSAKQVCGVHTICFITKEEYYRSFSPRAGREPTSFIDRIIWPQKMLAEEIARIVLVPEAIDVEILEGGRIWLQEYRIQPGSPLLEKPLHQLDLHPGLLAVAQAREQEFSVPRGDTRFEAGDKVTFMGTPRALRSLERHFFRRSVAEKVTNVAIIGGGNVGGIIANILEEEAERIRIKIIERDLARCETLAADLKSAMVLHGDGSDLELLDVEQIFLSDVLVAVTSHDEKDLLCSLLALEMEIPKVITRATNPANVHLFESLGISVALNPALTAIKTVVAYLQETSARLLAVTEQGKGNVIEMTVPDEFPVTGIMDLAHIDDVIIAAIVRRRKTIVPRGRDSIKPGDRLLIFATQEATESVEQYFA
ncbi:Trk system potassium transporter TrkA [Gemmatimonadota bacterium]